MQELRKFIINKRTEYNPKETGNLEKKKFKGILRL